MNVWKTPTLVDVTFDVGPPSCLDLRLAFLDGSFDYSSITMKVKSCWSRSIKKQHIKTTARERTIQTQHTRKVYDHTWGNLCDAWKTLSMTIIFYFTFENNVIPPIISNFCTLYWFRCRLLTKRGWSAPLITALKHLATITQEDSSLWYRATSIGWLTVGRI